MRTTITLTFAGVLSACEGSHVIGSDDRLDYLESCHETRECRSDLVCIDDICTMKLAHDGGAADASTLVKSN